MTAEQLKVIFENKYHRSNWYRLLRENFNVTTLREKPVDITNRVTSNPYNAKALELGNFNTTDGHVVGIYEVEVQEKSDITRNRKGLRNLLSQVYSTDVEAALLVFIQGNKWRFSYVSEITIKNKITGNREKKITDPKRFTYLLGDGERAKTAADRFARIQKSEDLLGQGITLNSLEDAFNVEKMSKLFFSEYRKHYGYFVAYLTGEDENGKKVNTASPFLRSTFNGNHKEARDFVKKMLGRIVFLYFLEKKGWLGVPESGTWGQGDENFLSNLYKHCKDKKAFYSNVLVPLFFGTLNTERKGDQFKIAETLFTHPGYNKLKIPYLNGGLFEEDEITTQFLVFPEELFAGLFDFFDRYNFTVYEDSPEEHTVAVDPEMLGHVFENLLEDNKDKGTFYTPKEIVHYMCRESLIEYLYSKLNPQQSETTKEPRTIMRGLTVDKLGQKQVTGKPKEKVSREIIEKFVLHHEAADIIEYEEDILKALKDVKICDPAIGSGAFPMGLLTEIFHILEAMNDITPDVTAKVWSLKNGWNPAKVKEEIIQNSIYGVDIEKGAVDIARLRFWLSLVVDEDSPKPLPNLDYKIVVGNSLLSKFEDEIINIDWGIHMGKAVEKTKTLIKEQELKLYDLQHKQYLYFKQPAVDKKKLQREIRNLKIDILINQLTLNKISFQEKNPRLGGFAPTPKEIQKNLENEITIATVDNTLQKLLTIKKDKDAILNFFNWKLNFPEVMNDKLVKTETGFDIVIANPPYVPGKMLTNETKSSLKDIYKLITGKFDLYLTFIELGILLNKPSQYNLIYIIPNTILSNENAKILREYLFENSILRSLVIFNDSVFEKQHVENVILCTSRHSKDIFKILDSAFNEIKRIEYTEVTKDTLYRIQVNKTSSDEILFKKIYSSSVKFGDISDTCIGIQIGGSGDSDEFKKKYISENKPDKNHKRIIDGKDFTPYVISWKNKYLNYGNWLHRKRDEKYFLSEKIIFRQIGVTPVATIDSESFYTLNTIYNSIITSSDFDIKYVFGLINSKLIKYIWLKIFHDSKTLFPKIKKTQLNEMPILKIDSNKQKLISQIVNKIISEKKNDPRKNIRSYENEIDLIIYKLYELTYEEVCTIEGNSEWMSKNEYDIFNLK